MNFLLLGLYIRKGCDKKMVKNLETEKFYAFNRFFDFGTKHLNFDLLEKYNGFFGEIIFVSAIVGKNGSGKSSILDLAYRIINNLGHEIFYFRFTNVDYETGYVRKVFADLYFLTGDEVGLVSCRGDSVGISIGNIRMYFGRKNKQFENDGYTQEFGFDKDLDVKGLLKDFFYTVVSNYSMQAFLDLDYADEETKKYRNEETVIWTNGVFHKNDGYSLPIVINPYRYKGVYDQKKEFQLTNYRLMSLLIAAKNKNKDRGIDEERLQLIEGYELDKIEFSLNKEIIYNKFEAYRKKEISSKELLERFRNSLRNNHLTYSRAVLEAYGLYTQYIDIRIDKSDPIVEHALLYLVYKTMNIAGRYPSYELYKTLGMVDFFDSEMEWDNEERAKQAFKDLVNKILKDPSHISFKVYQVLHLLGKYELYSSQIDADKEKSKAWDRNSDMFKPLSQKLKIKPETTFNYSQYEGYDSEDLASITKKLPPTFFVSEIFLKNVEESSEKKGISFKKLSAGEKQFIFTVSSILYHMENLISVDENEEDRVKYHQVNLVFDEVELCFHPEYQRTFLSKLVGTLKRLELTNSMAFNIIFVTHSPFILSDIPTEFIMYLENGKQRNGEEFKNPFGANINDILHQSFFLNHGFIGEFARKKIESLFLFLSNDEQSREVWEAKECKHTIRLIGEPLIREALKTLFQTKFNHSVDDEEIADR